MNTMERDIESLEENYILLSKIGSGTYGEVFKAKHIATNKTVAIKVCRVLKADPVIIQKQLVLLSRELVILHKMSKMVNNDYTVKLLDVFVNRKANEKADQFTSICFVMEYYDYDMGQIFAKDALIDEKQAKIILYNLLLAIKYLHSANIMHRDLKPSNILITDTCTVKLCDFGFARSIINMSSGASPNPVEQRRQRAYSRVCMTRYFRAPEIIFQQKYYDEKTDLWSFGCIASQLV